MRAADRAARTARDGGAAHVVITVSERATGVVQSVDWAGETVTLNGGGSFDINGASRADLRDMRPGQMVTILPNGRTHVHTKR